MPLTRTHRRTVRTLDAKAKALLERGGEAALLRGMHDLMVAFKPVLDAAGPDSMPNAAASEGPSPHPLPPQTPRNRRFRPFFRLSQPMFVFCQALWWPELWDVPIQTQLQPATRDPLGVLCEGLVLNRAAAPPICGQNGGSGGLTARPCCAREVRLARLRTSPSFGKRASADAPGRIVVCMTIFR